MRRVAFKIGLSVVLCAAGSGWVFAAMGMPPVAHAALTAVAAGAVAYASVRHLVGRPVEHVASVLNTLVGEDGREDAAAPVQGDELDRLVRRSDQALHAANKRFAELNKERHFRRDYVGDVSHEIKTPIFAIRGFAETLLNGALDDRNVNRGFVEKIFNHANRLDALANDLSEIARLETRALKLSMASFGAQAVLDEVRESLEMAARQKDIELRFVVEEGADRIEADRDRICQVLTNLLENAIKYTNPGGWAEVRVDTDAAGTVRLSVRDSGIGIEPEEVPRITERFYRADRSRARSQGGSGLGLSIVKHILAAHGTALRIESRVAEGSTFSFTLPAG